MGSCSCCDRNQREIQDEHRKLLKHSNYKKYGDTSKSSRSSSKNRIHRALNRNNTFLLKIGLMGDVTVVEKRCWLLRLLDEDEFDTDQQTQTEYLTNHQISQCNKYMQINNANYCAHIEIVNDMLLLNDDLDDTLQRNTEFDVNDYNALLLCYDITNIASFHKLITYLQSIADINTFDTQQIVIMGITPSCDMDQNEIAMKMDVLETRKLCKQYNDKDIIFAGITNAKTGENVTDLVKKVMQKCIDTQSMEVYT